MFVFYYLYYQKIYLRLKVKSQLLYPFRYSIFSSLRKKVYYTLDQQNCNVIDKVVWIFQYFPSWEHVLVL